MTRGTFTKRLVQTIHHPRVFSTYREPYLWSVRQRVQPRFRPAFLAPQPRGVRAVAAFAGVSLVEHPPLLAQPGPHTQGTNYSPTCHFPTLLLLSWGQDTTPFTNALHCIPPSSALLSQSCKCRGFCNHPEDELNAFGCLQLTDVQCGTGLPVLFFIDIDGVLINSLFLRENMFPTPAASAAAFIRR